MPDRAENDRSKDSAIDGLTGLESWLAGVIRRWGTARTTVAAMSLGTTASVIVSWVICIALGFSYWDNAMAVSMSVIVPLIVAPPFTYIYLRSITRLDQLAESRRLAMAASQRANEARLHFLAHVSHELRTPLNAVIGFSEVLENETFGPLGDSKYRDYASEIQKSGTHLLGLVNDLLTITDVASSSQPIEATDLHPRSIVRDITPATRALARKKGVRLRIHAPRTIPRFVGNKRSVRQVLHNLLSNAMKFSPDGGMVALIVTEDKDGNIAFEVHDHGPGIPQSILQNIGEPFPHDATSRYRRESGVGIGLSVARTLAQSMSADLTVRNRDGGGTLARVVFSASRHRRVCSPGISSMPQSSNPLNPMETCARLSPATRIKANQNRTPRNDGADSAFAPHSAGKHTRRITGRRSATSFSRRKED